MKTNWPLCFLILLTLIQITSIKSDTSQDTNQYLDELAKTGKYNSLLSIKPQLAQPTIEDVQLQQESKQKQQIANELWTSSLQKEIYQQSSGQPTPIQQQQQQQQQHIESAHQASQIQHSTLNQSHTSSSKQPLENQVIPGKQQQQQQQLQPQPQTQQQPINHQSQQQQQQGHQHGSHVIEQPIANQPQQVNQRQQQQQLPQMPYGSAPPISGTYHHHHSPLYSGHNPYIEILRPHSYVDDNIVTLNLSHSHIYEIDTDAFVGQRLEHIDLSNNKLGLIHSRSFQIGPSHSGHEALHSIKNKTTTTGSSGSRRPPPSHPMSVTIDFSHNPAILALPGAFDHIDVPNCMLNFTNSTVELKFGAFKKYFKEHPGHMVDIESVDCCEQEWLLGYRHNFVNRTHCDHDRNLILAKVTQQTIIDSCIDYVTRARHSMKIQGPSIIHQLGPSKGHPNSICDCHYLTYLILGGTAAVLTSLSIFIIFYMFSLKAAFVYQMQNKN